TDPAIPPEPSPTEEDTIRAPLGFDSRLDGPGEKLARVAAAQPKLAAPARFQADWPEPLVTAVRMLRNGLSTWRHPWIPALRDFVFIGYLFLFIPETHDQPL